MPKRNYGREKRQKELNRLQKRAEKQQRKLDRLNARTANPEPVDPPQPDLPPA